MGDTNKPFDLSKLTVVGDEEANVCIDGVCAIPDHHNGDEAQLSDKPAE